jgi:flagella basal body P-ring formation protein FlgA
MPRRSALLAPLAMLVILLAITVIAALAAPAAGTPARRAVVVRFAPETVVTRPDVLVGDVASVQGEDALARRLRTLHFGPAPAPGASHRLGADEVRLRLRQPGIDLRHVELVLPDHVVITRASQVLPAASLVDAVRAQLLPRLETPGAGRPAIVPVSPLSDLVLPTGTVQLLPQVQESASPMFVAATVTVRVDGRDYQSLPLTFRVGHYRDVLVAAHTLEPKRVLEPGDFRVESRPSTEVPRDALASAMDVPDLEAVVTVPAGEVIVPRMLRQKILVKRGEMVTLVLEGNGFRITTQGQASEDARRGDAVRVVNVSSKRELVGRVEGAGTVRIPAPATAARSDR